MSKLSDRVFGGPLDVRYDVVIIGGGISGVQVARHAAGRGLKALLVEQNDYGHATSAATTKAIHGGLRYLEQYDFAVVAESVRERRFLTIAAPHLVQPRSFLLTAYDWSKPPAPILGAGVGLYEAMALNRNVGVPRDVRSPRFKWIGKQALLKQVPWLQTDGLQGAWRHDDTLNLHAERLLLAMVKDFASLGGTAVNHASVVNIDREGSAIQGVDIRDNLSGETFSVAASAVINAAGPWVAEALGNLSGQAGVRVKQAKGVHLITKDLQTKEAVYVRGRNGRHIVVNPWEGRTLVGPTDTPTSGDPDSTTTDVSDINLLRETLDSVSSHPLTRDQVEDTIVGVRPLIDDGNDTYTSSRRFEVRDHQEQGLAGLFTVTGGKWTTGRAMGEKVIDTVVKAMAAKLPPTKRFDDTKRPLSSSFGDYDTVADAFTVAVQERSELSLSPAVREHLARLYGTEHTEVLRTVAEGEGLDELLWPGTSNDIAAQAVYAVTHEHALTLEDVIDRRLTVGTLGAVPDHVVEKVANIIAPLLGWDTEKASGVAAAYNGKTAARHDVIDQAFSAL
ncbi:glycerol-3-phosphate dehydrogenase/oxidase [Corynebacterium lubricantis]|uniref:glycerol-3-phosphate dehydrogenase/oxidase n=1 Tax=Corynebacterium lubricantis TaxID=541095 RepID=UPI0003613C84|nr:glycerol-3-phosphate dehydrogenase/oxidase [Corynebacterium lubricantis]